MFNLIMSGNDTAWDLPAYEFPTSRFLEYTVDSVAGAHSDLSAKVIDKLKSYPSLFLYECYEKDAFVGYIREIKQRGRAVAIEYEFDQEIGPIPAAKIKEIASKLEIDESRGEQYRTHWAVKGKDLLGILSEHEIIAAPVVNDSGVCGRLEEMRFKVAFSFPGELRNDVKDVADGVKASLPPGSVFYDDDFIAQLARPNLDTLLQAVYLKNSDLVVVFLSKDYESKLWCGIEWRAIRSIINSRSDETVMFVRSEECNVPGVFPQDGYVDMNRFPPDQIAKFVLERQKLVAGTS